MSIKCALGEGVESVVLCSHLVVGPGAQDRLLTGAQTDVASRGTVKRYRPRLGRPNGEEIEKFPMAPVAKVVRRVRP